MIEDHAGEAKIQAAMKADELLWNGDLDGAANWRMIVHRIEQLEAGPDRRRH